MCRSLPFLPIKQGYLFIVAFALGASRSLPTLSLDFRMMESLDRLLAQQITHRDHIHAFLRTSSLPVSDGIRTSSPGSFDDGGGPDGVVSGGGGGGGVDSFRGESHQLNPAHSTSLKPESALTNTTHPYSVLGECNSLKGCNLFDGKSVIERYSGPEL